MVTNFKLKASEPTSPYCCCSWALEDPLCLGPCLALCTDPSHRTQSLSGCHGWFQTLGCAVRKEKRSKLKWAAVPVDSLKVCLLYKSESLMSRNVLTNPTHCRSGICAFRCDHYNNYHVCVGDLLLYKISAGIFDLFVVWKQFLQSSQGSIGLRFLLSWAPPFKLLPINFHLIY